MLIFIAANLKFPWICLHFNLKLSVVGGGKKSPTLQKLRIVERKRRWRWNFCGLINFLQLYTVVTFMVLQFIVSHCCDDERQNEKSFLTFCSRKKKWEKKELFISTNDFAILYLPSVVIFELFSFSVQLFRPIHSSPPILFSDKTAKTNKEKESGSFVLSAEASEIISQRMMRASVELKLGKHF